MCERIRQENRTKSDAKRRKKEERMKNDRTRSRAARVKAYDDRCCVRERIRLIYTSRSCESARPTHEKHDIIVDNGQNRKHAGSAWFA